MSAVVNNVLPVELLRNLITYDPLTGELVWTAGTPEVPNWGWRRLGWPALRAANTNGQQRGKIMGVWVTAARVCVALHTGQWPESIVRFADNDPGNLRATNLLVKGVPAMSHVEAAQALAADAALAAQEQ